MYWTTPKITISKHLRPAPLDTQLSTSGEERIRAIKALMHLINPISAQLLPLLRVYYLLRRSVRLECRQPLPLLSYFEDNNEDVFILRSLHVHICLLLQEAEDHYIDFCELYEENSLGEVVGMMQKLKPDERAYYEGVPRDWDDFTYLIGDAGLRQFWHWKPKVVDFTDEDVEVEVGEIEAPPKLQSVDVEAATRIGLKLP